MKRFLSIVLFTTILASPVLAQNAPTTTKGGDPNVTGQSTQGIRTITDPSVHTTFDNGVVVTTSTGTDGKPNGGAGNSSGGTTGVTPPAH